MALWAGRFKKEIDKTTNDFNSSIPFDQRMYKQDIEGSIAHATMLGEQEIITRSDSNVIVAELKRILLDLEQGTLLIDDTAEDIHMFIEQELTNRLSSDATYNVGKRDGCDNPISSNATYNVGKRDGCDNPISSDATYNVGKRDGCDNPISSDATYNVGKRDGCDNPISSDATYNVGKRDGCDNPISSDATYNVGKRDGCDNPISSDATYNVGKRDGCDNPISSDATYNVGKRDGCDNPISSDATYNVGKRLHTARSRNDQVALDLRMHLKVEVCDIIDKLKSLTSILCDVSSEHTDTIMCGYTHLQRAQPITLAHHLMAYAQMFLRDIDRLTDANRRMNSMPLGSGALASTTYPICRERVADLLGFDSVTQNSLDGVSDRDFCIEICSDLSIIMMHLSRFCEEIILWCSWEFKFIELDDAFATGSSIMPQKKNPDIAELIRGKTGRVYGSLITLLTVMKGIPLAYNKDMQEDKEAIFDAVDTVKLCIDTFSPMLKTMTVLKDNMRIAAAKGFINATDCADYLVKKGLPFRDAYKITGTLVAQCIDAGVVLETLPLEKYKTLCTDFDEDIYCAISLETCVNGRSVIGGPAGATVKTQIATVRERLCDDND